MKELTCIVCPRGCRLQVDETKDYTVTGHSCPRGEEYGRTECTAPLRTLTATVPVINGDISRCPVKTVLPIPKEKLWDAMRAIRALTLQAPIQMGEVLLSHIAGTNVDLVACRPVQAKTI